MVEFKENGKRGTIQIEDHQSQNTAKNSHSLKVNNQLLIASSHSLTNRQQTKQEKFNNRRMMEQQGYQNNNCIDDTSRYQERCFISQIKS